MTMPPSKIRSIISSDDVDAAREHFTSAQANPWIVAEAIYMVFTEGCGENVRDFLLQAYNGDTWSLMEIIMSAVMRCLIPKFDAIFSILIDECTDIMYSWADSDAIYPYMVTEKIEAVWERIEKIFNMYVIKPNDVYH